MINEVTSSTKAAEGTEVIKAKAPSKLDRISIRMLIFIGILSLIVFLYWLLQPEHVGNQLLFGMLAVSLLFKILRVIHEWYHYYNINVPSAPESHKSWTVDVLTTACPGEPYEMIVETLQAMSAIDYPHTNYLCDEGDDPYLKSVCENLRVIHVTRIEKKDAKAGNINNALQRATGEICVILDPDHQPHPRFLHEVLPYFEDEKIGYVQTVQPYKNQKESFVARGAAEQTYQFYGPLMMSMSDYNTVQAIGANCAFRRSALDSIGGHAAGLSEDMHTAMLLHAKGWKSVYVPSMLTRGLVPASLSGYFKQQLKWSRGTFDLLFYKIPQLFRQFSWRQKIHYLSIPLYFFFGFITLIDLLIPILGLTLMDSPLKIETGEFFVYVIPFLFSSLLIRLFSQKWTLEEHEKGFHIVGGILYSASWWVFATGFIYTLLKIKVPYIPTPKDDKPRNEWRLSLPSLLVTLVCLLAIIYGLGRDWNPYSLVMAGFAGLNALIFFTAFTFGQQKLLLDVKKWLFSNQELKFLIKKVKYLSWQIRYTFYYLLRQWALPLLSISILIIGSFKLLDENHALDFHSIQGRTQEKYLGGFYIGWEQTEEGQLSTVENVIRRKIDIAYHEKVIFTSEQLQAVLSLSKENYTIPLIYLQMADLQDQNEYYERLKAVFLAYGLPVMVSLQLPEDEKPVAEAYIQHWQDFVLQMDRSGVHNVSWVWDATETSSLQLYPGSRFVDWIAYTLQQQNTADLENQLEKFSSLRHPVLLKKVSPAYPQLGSLFSGLPEQESMIRAIVFEGSTGNILAKESLSELNKLQEYLNQSPFVKSPTSLVSNLDLGGLRQAASYRKLVGIEGEAGSFGLKVGDEDFYIKSICYNPEHDWRDHHIPLTRPQLERDFERMKAMGANTIRRYEPGPYDKNILNIASEYQFKVLYGFWFDPQVDYLQDSVTLQKYYEKVIEGVKRYKDHPAILAWGIGNETWGLLKKKYHEPYLSYVRQNYARFLNDLARAIHQIDPDHPVFTAGELLLNQTEAEVQQLKELAPELDFIAINSYYDEQISQLDELMIRLDPSRPYLVSEFGPDGYWDTRLSNLRNDTILIEEGSFAKAHKYAKQWEQYIVPNRGKNIGGSAFCWSDRMEGSATWFGLVDDLGNIKPGYYALQSVWTDRPVAIELPDVRILGSWYDVPVNEKVEFSAVIVNDYAGELNYRWYLCEDEYLDHVNSIEISQSGSTVSLYIPDPDKKYRVYVHVTDMMGNVVTASKPISAEVKTYL